ncbi:hypothetical protein ACHAQK_009889 [Fusarium lateritium]
MEETFRIIDLNASSTAIELNDATRLHERIAVELNKTERVAVKLKEALAEQGYRLLASLEDVILVAMENESTEAARMRQTQSSVHELQQCLEQEQIAKHTAQDRLKTLSIGIGKLEKEVSDKQRVQKIGDLKRKLSMITSWMDVMSDEKLSEVDKFAERVLLSGWN